MPAKVAPSSAPATLPAAPSKPRRALVTVRYYEDGGVSLAFDHDMPDVHRVLSQAHESIYEYLKSATFRYLFDRDDTETG